MKSIFPEGRPAPAGHYSPAVVANNGLVFVSGVLPTNREASFREQVEEVLDSCKAILEAAGCTLDSVVQATAYIVGVQNWPEFNTVYAEFFGQHKPARAVVPVPELHYGATVEIQLVAELSDS